MPPHSVFGWVLLCSCQSGGCVCSGMLVAVCSAVWLSVCCNAWLGSLCGTQRFVELLLLH